ncbi:MAG: hypothetical protein LBU42_03155 [Prevotellaceae bacterium]|jgi:hypothetical protein|nr:hypothetical protein [Prevotellaceae bacterium]
METNVLLTSPPDSIEGVFADRYFRQHLQAEIDRIKVHDYMALEKGQKWKRRPYDTLFENGVMTVPRIIGEYVKIKQKTSTLSAGCRNAVSYLVADATRQMYDTYRKINCMT